MSLSCNSLICIDADADFPILSKFDSKTIVLECFHASSNPEMWLVIDMCSECNVPMIYEVSCVFGFIILHTNALTFPCFAKAKEKQPTNKVYSNVFFMFFVLLQI